jgi:hypothetical protein
MARNTSFLGLVIWMSLSRYTKMRRTISVSVRRRLGSFACVQLWMMPFMSRYRLSISGGASVAVTGMLRRGYLSLNHL